MLVSGIDQVTEAHLGHHPTWDIGFLLTRGGDLLLAYSLLLLEVVLLLSRSVAVCYLYADIYGELAEEATCSRCGSGIEDPGTDSAGGFLKERGGVFLLSLLFDMLLQCGLAHTLRDIEQGALGGLAKEIVSSGLRYLLLNKMVNHLFLQCGIYGDVLLLQLSLDHGDIVVHGLAVPLADVIQSGVVGIHGGHTTIGAGGTCHHSAEGCAVSLHFLGLMAIELVTDFVHNGLDLGGEDVLFLCICHDIILWIDGFD